jgi:hypothetical protein
VAPVTAAGSAGDTSCGGHAGLSDDLRALALTAIDRIGPVLDRMRDEPAPPPGARPGRTCGVCPLCAVISALRGERPELAARLAEHAAGMLAVLRAGLEDGTPAPAEPSSEPAPPPGRRVQHIRVDRAAR